MPTLVRPMRLSRLALYSAILLAVFKPLTLASEPGTPQAHFVREWGSKGNAPRQFDFPIGVAVECEGRILVVDFYNARVQRFSPEGKYQASFEVLANPGGIAVDVQGNIYLAHFSAMKLKERPSRTA